MEARGKGAGLADNRGFFSFSSAIKKLCLAKYWIIIYRINLVSAKALIENLYFKTLQDGNQLNTVRRVDQKAT